MLKTSIIFIIIIIVFLGAVFFIKLKSSVPVKATKIFHMTVRSNKLVNSPTTISVMQGDKVTLLFTADVNGTFQLHGYNKEWHYTKNQQTPITFIASMSGRFPYELEDTDTEIGVLSVYPK